MREQKSMAKPDASKGNEKIKWWDSFIAHNVSGKWIINFLKPGTMLRISDKEIEAHYNTNIAVLAGADIAGGFFQSGQLIENQEEWGEVAFGTVSMKQAGCGIMATYNARVSLGEKPTQQDMAGLISLYERRGAVCRGKYGLAPTAPYKYFKSRGYEVDMTTGVNPEDLNAMGQKYDTFILYSYNNRDKVTDGMHMVNISKDTKGYQCHNGYHWNPKTNVWDAGEAKDSLWEAVRALSGGKAKPVCVIGINRKG